MAKSTYTPDAVGTEVEAPWGYYQPLEEASLDYLGRRVLYTLGSACIEASCCGKGSWSYARVEGYVAYDAGEAAGGPAAASAEQVAGPLEVDTVEDAAERAAIAQALVQKHPGVRVEFR